MKILKNIAKQPVHGIAPGCLIRIPDEWALDYITYGAWEEITKDPELAWDKEMVRLEADRTEQEKFEAKMEKEAADAKIAQQKELAEAEAKMAEASAAKAAEDKRLASEKDQAVFEDRQLAKSIVGIKGFFPKKQPAEFKGSSVAPAVEPPKPSPAEFKGAPEPSLEESLAPIVLREVIGE